MNKTIFKTLVAIAAIIGTSTMVLAAPLEQIINNASISSPTVDLVPANNTAQVIDKLCYRSDFSSTLTDTATTVAPLSSNTFTATINNAGPSTTTIAQLDFTYDNRNYASIGTPTFNVGTLNTTSTSTVANAVTVRYVVTNLTLASGQSLIATITATATANPQTVVNTSFTGSPIGPVVDSEPTCTMADPNTANNGSADVTTGQLQADLSITKISSGGANSAGAIVGSMNSKTAQTYTLTGTNNGPSSAVGPITIIDTIPTLVTPTNVSGSTCTPGAGSTAGLTCAYNSANRQMTFTLSSNLANAGNVIINIPVTIN